MIYERFSKLTDDRIVASLVGMTKAEFNALAKPFEKAAQALQRERVVRGEIKQARRGGGKGPFRYDREKIIFYLKTYPTFDVLGFHFGLSGGHAHTHVDQLSAVLRRTLSDLNVLPESAVIGPGDFHKLIENYKDIAIDGVECACVRPQDEEEQERCYSGKKKTYTEGVSGG